MSIGNEVELVPGSSKATQPWPNHFAGINPARIRTSDYRQEDIPLQTMTISEMISTDLPQPAVSYCLIIHGVGDDFLKHRNYIIMMYF